MGSHHSPHGWPQRLQRIVCCSRYGWPWVGDQRRDGRDGLRDEMGLRHHADTVERLNDHTLLGVAQAREDQGQIAWVAPPPEQEAAPLAHAGATSSPTPARINA